ncbi:MAG: pirin family protein [Candidatus Caenarcaniphilales bacterium]|nr:pirin family protein [Candidatus Caenarcaniphilales bacterium]
MTQTIKKTIHRANERGYANHGWLQSYHSFSFADYYNPQKMSFGLLRVINDDRIAAGGGFGMHGHQDMEIVTIPLYGNLKHQDSIGNSSVISAGEVQIMSAGTGIRHSEFNYSEKDKVELLQIWVLPKEKGIKPRYDQQKFDLNDRKNKFETVVSPNEDGKAVWINQNAFFSLASIEEGKSIEYKLKDPNNGIYVYLIEGEIEVADEKLESRDALGLEGIQGSEIQAKEKSEVLVIEVPMN